MGCGLGRHDLAAKRAALELALAARPHSSRLFRGVDPGSGLGGAPGTGQPHAGGHRGLSQPGPDAFSRRFAFAGEQKIPLDIIATAELDRPEYARNDGARCFFPRTNFSRSWENFCEARDFHSIAYGVNLDDQGDFRPGQRAAKEHRVAAPLLEADDQAGYPRSRPRRRPARSGTSRLRPASPPASSTAARLRAKRSARSSAAKTRCARWVSARSGCAITVNRSPGSGPRGASAGAGPRNVRRTGPHLQGAGLQFVTLDLEGFRSGSMNTLLSADQLARGR